MLVYQRVDINISIFCNQVVLNITKLSIESWFPHLKSHENPLFSGFASPLN